MKKFSGVLKLQPYPHLLVARPGATGTQPSFSTYYLVAPFKFGLDREKISALDGKNISLQGTLIYRGSQTMVEALPDSIKAIDGDQRAGVPYQSLGRQTLVGEIVDAKCFLGVMNPGQLTPHRACAIRCISGGVPPVLLVRQKDGPAIYLLLGVLMPRRAMVLAVAYTLIFELMISFVPAVINKITVQYRLRSLAAEWCDISFSGGSPSGALTLIGTEPVWHHITVLVLLPLFLVGLSVAMLRSSEFSSAIESDT